mmetsp:Transcript_4989/g.10098  ORF Transcript_4989/g.10098 Transcript_4989/m.10098 type:complete len:512 (+) Transcript_4989:131-1666(+)
MTTYFSVRKQTPRKQIFLVITFFVVTAFVYLKNIRHEVDQLPIQPILQKKNFSQISSKPSLMPPLVSKIDRPSWCDALKSHSSGHWHHEYAPVNNKTFDFEDVRMNFFHDEMQWLQGKNIPSFGMKTCNSYEGMKSGKMYVTKLGNQCGCEVPEFRPSLSKWVPNETINRKPSTDSINENYGVHSSLRLAYNLAQSNYSHLCFVGDSIDYSIYDAFKVNLLRTLKLRKDSQLSYKYPVLSVEEREYEVNVSRTDNGIHYVPPGWRQLKRILESEVTLNNSSKTAKFSYFQHYGWSPWDVELLENCNIIVMNLSLHYNSDSGRGNRFGNLLADDTRAAITTLVNFTTTTTTEKNRIAIWRSTLPQHFNTKNGHFENANITDGFNCVPLKISFREQSYNVVHKIVFEDMCRRDHDLKGSCSSYEQHCTANIRETKYQTTYQFRQSNNLTTWVNERENPVKIGTILQWDISDIFDNHLWHPDSLDCTHYCYIPQVFDAAFERLDLLLRIKLKNI